MVFNIFRTLSAEYQCISYIQKFRNYFSSVFFFSKLKKILCPTNHCLPLSGPLIRPPPSANNSGTLDTVWNYCQKQKPVFLPESPVPSPQIKLMYFFFQYSNCWLRESKNNWVRVCVCVNLGIFGFFVNRFVSFWSGVWTSGKGVWLNCMFLVVRLFHFK